MPKDTTLNIVSLTKEEQQFVEYRKLKDKYFIGRFNETESGYTISDIRRSDFSKIKYKPTQTKAFTMEENGSLDQVSVNDSYYRFTWKMVKSKPDYVFEVDKDEEIIPLSPKDIVKLLYDDMYNYSASADEKIVNTLDTIKNQLTASGKEVFIYELLQNANDYPQKVNGKKMPVDVVFNITDKYLVFQHSGDYFDAKNIAAICNINDKEKTDNAEAIGYKGIGFKTVFLDNDYVLLRTGKYQFRFDYEYSKNFDDTPWQILPIWTENKEVEKEVLDVMDNADDKYRVQIALRPTESEILHTGKQNYEELFSDVFETERVILFIPYVNSVSVYMNGEEKPSIVRIKENDKWCVSEPKKYVGDIPEELTNELNGRIKKNDGKIPEKYYNFRKTSVGFACRREGNKLLPVENSCLYCYLPAKMAKLGFGFLMNTDMIPTGPRDNVEPKENINHAIAKIAGQQFFKWIHNLLEDGQFDYESIFSLIPNFEELEEKNEDKEDILQFIKEFKEGFEDELDNGNIIPVINEEGKTIFIPVGEVNYDKTGITCSGIMSDDELLKLTDWQDYFVHPNLRDTENLCLKPNITRFLDCYVSSAYTFEEKELLKSCEKEDFSNWLSEENNNHNFLNFLLNKGFIEDFSDKEILLTETGEYLNPAKSTYYDIDAYYPDLKAFDDYLPRLSMSTRNYFKNNKEWDKIKGIIFKEFDPDHFVDSELCSINHIRDTKERLEEPKASYGFYNFLAKNVGFTSSYKDFPVISFKSTVIEDFNRKVYFYHKDGETLSEESWTQDSWINLISEEYSSEAKKYFKENFDVQNFSVDSYIEDVLLASSDIRNDINELGQEHIDFVHYCYAHKDCFDKGDLKDFSLLTYDKEGQREQILSEDIIFFDCNEFEIYQSKNWIQDGWMYKLDNDYLKDIDNINNFKQFMEDTFNVHPFTQEIFYNAVVKKNAKWICQDLGGTNTESDIDDSIDVLTYLGENYKIVFEDNDNRFIHLPLYRYDTWDEVTDRDTEVYLYNEELKDIIEAKWAPEDFVYMLSEKYNEIFTKYPMLIKTLDIKKYSFKNVKDILLDDITSLDECIKDKEENISFHRFMYDKDDISKSDFKKLEQLPIYAVDYKDEESCYYIDEALYISDAYMEEGKGMEAMVKKYDETAFFTSNAYLTDDANEQEIADWKDYFIKLGINSDNKDIIFNSVLPNLSEIKDKNIVSLLAGYYDYFHADGEWDDALKKLKHLNVLVKGGDDDFRPLKDVLFNDCYDMEPYPYLVIADEIDSFYQKSPDVMRLLRDIVDGCKQENSNQFRSFKTVDEWKIEKLDWYLYLQKEDLASLETIHEHFICDLAKDYTLNYNLYSKVKVKDIMLLGKDGQYHKAKELTEGMAYQPRCNFEKYDIPLTYLSENYLQEENSEPKDFRKLFTDMEVNYDFHSEHLIYMRDNYAFTVYFWTEYLKQYQNRTHITASGVNGKIADELNKYATIPTGNLQKKEVKKPKDIYNLSLIRGGYVKNMIPFCEDKMPLESIFSTEEVSEKILWKLDFANSLSFSDCLECLLRTNNKAKRQTILCWLSTKHSIDHTLVDKYLKDENSKWKNGRGKFELLRNLLVIHIDEDRIRQLFGKNEKVMSQEYIDSKPVFDAFCRIFNIDPLTEDDFELTPKIIEEPTTEEMRQILRLPLLIVAAVSDPDNWKEKYEHFCSDLNKLVFHKCDSITLNYKGILKDTSIQYHKNGNVLYFVREWNGRRVFKDIIFDLVEYLDIDLDNNMLEGIFEAEESNQADLIDKYVNYEVSISTEFMNTLMELNETIAKGVHASYDEEDDDAEEDDKVSAFGTNTHNEVNDENELVAEENEDAVNELVTKTEEQTKSEDSSQSVTDYNDTEAREINDTEESSLELSHQFGLEEDNSINEEVNSDEEAYQEETTDEDDYQVSSSEGLEQPEEENSGLGHKKVSSYETSHHDYSHNSTNDQNEIRSENEDDNGNYSSTLESNSHHEEKKAYRHEYSSRKNYMGYNPDETRQRPFNVGKQESTTLETRDVTEEEVSRLSSLLGRAYDKDTIMDENYLVRMRFYNSVKETVGIPEISEKEFVEKGSTYVHTKNGKYVHRCSARGGILYISPSIWNKVKYENCIICMYYGKKANQFLYIRSQKELMDMIDKDAVIIQVTGNDKGAFINKVYDSKFPGMNGNIYTMIRTIKTSGDDFIFGEDELVNKNDTDFDPDLV